MYGSKLEKIQSVFKALVAENGNNVTAGKKFTSSVLRCSESTIDKRIAQGKNLPRYKKVGKFVVFNLYDVAEFLTQECVEIY